MLRNYFIIAVRNLARNRFYSLVNIIGLSVGLACSLLIMLYVKDELSFDRFHNNVNRIYRVIGFISLNGQGEKSSSCPFPVAPTLAKDYPDMIEETVRFFNFQEPQHTLRVGDIKLNEQKIFVADSNVFRVFDFPLIKGNPEGVLKHPYSIVITENLAKKYFGNLDVIGKKIKYDGYLDLTVTGLLENVPSQSHIHFDALISFSTLRKFFGEDLYDNWVWNPNWTYVLLKKGVSPEMLEKRLPEFVQKYYPEHLKPQITHILQPLKDIHLHSRYDYEIEANGDSKDINMFIAISLFIIIIASINFMNLSTARSANRAREVGMRKVAGAEKKQLVFQYMAESVILSLISVSIALVMAELFLPYFNSLANKSFSEETLLDPVFLIGLAVLGVVTGLLSGVYPALFLSSYNPIDVLKGRLSSVARNITLRRSLVIIQFSISVVLIIATFIVIRQLSYMQHADLGFNKDRVLIVPVRPTMTRISQQLVSDLKSRTDVERVTMMNDILGKSHNTHEFNYQGLPKGKWIYLPALLVDENFIPAMDMHLIAGRNFSSTTFRDDSLAVIVNESMVKKMNWGSPEQAIGKSLHTQTGNEKVVGVVQDFHSESLINPVTPFVLDMPHRKSKGFWLRYIAIKTKNENAGELLAYMNERWNYYTKEFPFEYFNLDRDLKNQYGAQENLARLISYFSVLGIFIACLGLFALSAYTAEIRNKEIGIRKVMGATVTDVIKLVSADFIKLVLVSNIIAWPVAWVMLHNWLKNFAFRIEIPIAYFFIASGLAFFIAVITVSIQALKAALTDPAQSIKYE